MNPRPFVAFILCVCVVLSAVQTTAKAARFIPIGFLPGEDASRAEGVSGDGRFVVGQSGAQSFRWSEAGGMQMLGDLPGGLSYSGAIDASADGSVVVGYGSSADYGDEAFRWTEAGGMEGLGILPGFNRSHASAVSGDGTVVVGTNYGGGNRRAFRWTEAGGMQNLGVLQPGHISFASGVSADGSIVVGRSGLHNLVQGFRWTLSGGMQGLAPLPGDLSSVANGISADGRVIVGHSGTGAVGQLVRWTDAGVVQGLGTLPGHNYADAHDVSGDGSVIVGTSGDTMFLWTEAAEMRPLEDVLTDAGVDLTGWTLRIVEGISDDGNAIVGWGINPMGVEEGWLAALGPVPDPGADFDGDGDVDGDDFLLWQAGFPLASGAIKSDGDYDNDGDVDGDDFLGWQADFGSGSGSTSAAVPEPASIVLLIATLVGAVLVRWRR